MWTNPRWPLPATVARYLDYEVAQVHRLSRLVECSVGLPLVHPFGDVEIAKIAAVLPWELRYGRQGGRMLLRQATIGILPEEVRLRTTKSLMPNYYLRFFRRCLETEPFQEGGCRLEFLLSQPWPAMRREALAGAPGSNIREVYFIGSVGAWLHEQSTIS